MTLDSVLRGSPYVGYEYGYPHKTAYRPLAPLALSSLWAPERRDSLFLYLHVPFCEMRCGFCNLFTQTNPRSDFVETYLRALGRQARRVRQSLGEARFVRLAVGGGTPTFLPARQLGELFGLCEEVLGGSVSSVPASVEVSPETLDAEKIALLRSFGVERVSIGVQSFVDAEAAAMLRPQRRSLVETQLEALTLADFPTLNIDLIYGGPGQTEKSWLGSIDAALRYQPEELYLYPLYVRPLTGLGRHSRSWDDDRLALYRLGRDRLRAAGYTQHSMRMFRLATAGSTPGPVYCVQDDGMVGLGCGARSYTTGLHYATDWAVSARSVKEILAAWVERDEAAFGIADYGVELDIEEQQRRYVMLTLLTESGVDRAAFSARFGVEVLTALPMLHELSARDLMRVDPARLWLSDAGMERSDALGPWLRSAEMQARMDEFELR